jgi:two-component system, cell cycle sensor histidine kinase and response regulator CckA
VITRPTGAAADLFQTLVENSSDAIALFDEAGVLRFGSRSASKILGYAPGERLDTTVRDLIHPDDLETANALFAKALAQPGVPATGVFRVRHKDGSWHCIESVAVSRVKDPAVGGVIVNWRDVTERVHAEEAHRASEERLRHFVENAQDIIYYCSSDGRFTYVNPTASRIMKFSETELLGRHFLTLIRPDHRPAAAEFYQRQMADRIPNTYFEFPALTKDGETVWVGQNVQLVWQRDDIVGVQAIARDITKQKDAEERLRRSEARYRSLVEGAAIGIFRTTIDGAIVDANPALAEMLGYDSVDELRAMNINEIYATPSTRVSIIERYRREGLRRLVGNVTWKKKDGAEIIVRLTGRIVEGDADGPDGFETIAEDITERRALEIQLRQAQKMEAVGRLARGIAHDFNNVLAAVLGCSDVLRHTTDREHPASLEAIEIAKAAERGASLTRQLLAFSAPQTSGLQLLDVHGVVRSFHSMLQRLCGDIPVRLHTPGPPPNVRAEPGQIEQVVMNLVVNARDAVGDGGTIDVTVDSIETGPEKIARYPDLPPGKWARIAVHDTGAGIAPEVQRHVFEPFFSTKDPSKGSGLGLSIVYSIAKEAGGTVTFVTGPRQGTTFEVLLPIARG